MLMLLYSPSSAIEVVDFGYPLPAGPFFLAICELGLMAFVAFLNDRLPNVSLVV